MKQKQVALFSVFFCFSIFFTEISAQTLFLRGKVLWSNDSSGVTGLKVQLQKDSATISDVFTNEKGLFAFFDIKEIPDPSHCIITIYSHNKLIKEIKLGEIRIGERIRDIYID